MFCPNCKSEYVSGIVICRDCGVNLVERLEEAKHPETRLVPVFSDGNPGLIALVKSLLEDAGIFFYVKGEESQNLFGVGTLGLGFNPIIGPVVVMVKEEDLETAIKILKDLNSPASDGGE